MLYSPKQLNKELHYGEFILCPVHDHFLNYHSGEMHPAERCS